MSRSRPITGAASGDHDRYRENFDRIFGKARPYKAKLRERRALPGGASKPRCGECMEPLARKEVGFCTRCLKGWGPGLVAKHE